MQPTTISTDCDSAARTPRPYVYVLREMLTGRLYIGVRVRNVKEGRHWKDDLLVKYFTSSRRIKGFCKNNPAFLPYIQIGEVREFDTAAEAYAFEERLINEHDAVKSDFYYNRANRGKQWNTAGLSVNKGAIRTAEHRAKISKTLTGRKPLPESIEKAAAKNRGKKRTPEQCARISKALIGRKRAPFSDETRRRMSEAKIGKKQAPEVVAKRAEMHRGKKRSPETCAKIGKASRRPDRIAKLVARNKSKTRRAVKGQKSLF